MYKIKNLVNPAIAEDLEKVLVDVKPVEAVKLLEWLLEKADSAGIVKCTRAVRLECMQDLKISQTYYSWYLKTLKETSFNNEPILTKQGNKAFKINPILLENKPANDFNKPEPLTVEDVLAQTRDKQAEVNSCNYTTVEPSSIKFFTEMFDEDTTLDEIVAEKPKQVVKVEEVIPAEKEVKPAVEYKPEETEHTHYTDYNLTKANQDLIYTSTRKIAEVTSPSLGNLAGLYAWIVKNTVEGQGPVHIMGNVKDLACLETSLTETNLVEELDRLENITFKNKEGKTRKLVAVRTGYVYVNSEIVDVIKTIPEDPKRVQPDWDKVFRDRRSRAEQVSLLNVLNLDKKGYSRLPGIERAQKYGSECFKRFDDFDWD